MARIRTIKPTFFTSRSVADLPIPVRLTFVGLWTYVDDEGRGEDDPRLVKAALWPLDDKLNAKVVAGHLEELAKQGFICRYTQDGDQYLHVCGFGDHQRINRPQPSRLPAAPHEHSVTTHPPFTERSRNDHGTISEPSRETLQGKERKGKERKGTSSSPPPETHDDTDAPSDEEEDEAMQEARRRLADCRARGHAVPFPEKWLTTVAANVRAEPEQPAKPQAAAPNCATCNDLALAEPCPDCEQRRSA